MKKITIDNKAFFSPLIEFLNEGKAVELTVKGHSMLPFFKHEKTQVTLKKQPQYKHLDVVLAYDENRYVLHRIIKIKGDTMTLKGDGAFSKEVVSVHDIFGKVITYKDKQKLKTPYGFKVHVWLFLTPIRRILLKLVRR